MNIHIFLFAILFNAIVCEVKGQEIENSISTFQRRRPCNIAYRCSDQINVQWASDGSTCTPIRNACILASTNCDRRNQYLPVLRVVGKTACQRLCSEVCTKIFDPVCAYYNGQTTQFSNNCTLSVEVCRTGKIYDYTIEGECPTMCECPNKSSTNNAWKSI